MKNWLFITVLVLASVLVFSLVAPMVFVYTMRDYSRQRMKVTLIDPEHASLPANAQVLVDKATGEVQLTPSVPASAPPAFSVLADPAGDRTEDNYLARVIVNEILKQAVFARHPADPIPATMTEMVTVNGGVPNTVSVYAPLPDSPYFQTQLTVGFAWDAAGYAHLAQAALGDQKPAAPDPQAEGCLADLLEPTGAKLAAQDVRLSAELKAHPLDLQAHEEAALVLLSVALRENAGAYDDVRVLLGRATAHLALADALTGDSLSWNNRIADVALRVLAGRETDARQVLDNLASRSDCPAAARNWIDALRIWNQQDVTGAAVTAASPRLVKIAWFQTLARNLPLQEAIAALEKLGPPDKIVDWTRALMAQPEPVPVEVGNRFCAPALTMEFAELGEIVAAENGAPVDQGHLDSAFAETPVGTIMPDGKQGVRVQVVGLGTFKASTRHHLFQTLDTTFTWLAHQLGSIEGAKAFVGQTASLYHNVPFFELVQLTVRDESAPRVSLPQALAQEHRTWNIADLPISESLGKMAGDPDAAKLAIAYFQHGTPIGTAYDDRFPGTIGLLKDGPNFDYPGNLDPHANLHLLFLQHLQAMRPHSFAIAKALLTEEQVVPADQALAEMEPFLKDNVHALVYMDRMDGTFFHLSAAQRESLLKAHSALDPDFLFTYGYYLMRQGRTDEAIAIDRQGVARAHDQVLVSNSVKDIVDYDYAHGQTKEAMDLAQKAAGVGSQRGMMTYLSLLEKTGDLEPAEKIGLTLRDSYGDTEDLLGLYVRHPDRFKAQAAAARQQAFPDGMTPAVLASFKDTPADGVLVGTESAAATLAGLRMGDVIVALNGTRVGNLAQYTFLRCAAVAPELSLIAWHPGGGYSEIKASPENHLFGVKLDDYHP